VVTVCGAPAQHEEAGNGERVGIDDPLLGIDAEAEIVPHLRQRHIRDRHVRHAQFVASWP
jgi:hypothetical protein